jgi:phosphoglycerate-specific signal transduction histidine kinase
MKPNTEDLVKARHLAFVGSVTASLSHEIKNTLAIISETSGLMVDLLDYSAPPPEWEPYPRLKTLLASIAEQVERSGIIIKRLNRFAHSMDEQLVDLELNGLLVEITNLAQRFARLREVHLETSLAGESLNIRSDPFQVQQVVFRIIEGGLNVAPKNTTVTVASMRDGGVARVVITDEAQPRAGWLMKQVSAQDLTETEEQGDIDIAVLGVIMANLGGTIEAEDMLPQGNKVILTFPLENN